MDKNIGKNISKIVSDKYSQKLFDNAKQSTTYGLKTTSKRVIQEKTEATGDLIDNEITFIITKVSWSSPYKNLETITNERDKKIPKERSIYISRRKTENFLWSKINITVSEWNIKK